MGISLKDTDLIEIDTYFELVDLFLASISPTKSSLRLASQSDIDAFLV